MTADVLGRLPGEARATCAAMYQQASTDFKAAIAGGQQHKAAIEEAGTPFIQLGPHQFLENCHFDKDRMVLEM